MADDKKSKSGWADDLKYFLAIFILLFIAWVITGGPNRDTYSRENYFIDTNFNTYR
jgi:hypothetical protein